MKQMQLDLKVDARTERLTLALTERARTELVALMAQAILTVGRPRKGKGDDGADTHT